MLNRVDPFYVAALARGDPGRRRRLAEAQERGEWCGSIGHQERENLTGLSVTEILHRGRARVTKLKQGAPTERPETPSAPRAKLDLRWHELWK